MFNAIPVRAAVCCALIIAIACGVPSHAYAKPPTSAPINLRGKDRIETPLVLEVAWNPMTALSPGGESMRRANRLHVGTIDNLEFDVNEGARA